MLAEMSTATCRLLEVAGVMDGAQFPNWVEIKMSRSNVESSRRNDVPAKWWQYYIVCPQHSVDSWHQFCTQLM